MVLIGSSSFLFWCTENYQNGGKVESSITRDTIEANRLVAHGDSLTETQKDSSIANYKKALSFAKHPIKEIDVLIKLSQSYWDPFDTLSIYYAEKALTISESINNLKKITYSNFFLGRVYMIAGNFTKGLKYLELAKQLSQKYSFRRIEGSCLLTECTAFTDMGDYYQALISGNQGLEIFNQLNDTASVVFTNARIGYIYSSLGNYSQALTYFYKSIDFIGKISSKKTKSWIYASIANCYQLLGEYEEALFYFNNASKINEQTNIPYSQILVLNGKSKIYRSQRKYNESKELINKAFEIAQEINSIEQIILSYILMASIEFDLGNYDEALRLFKLALEKSITSNYKPYISLLLSNISEVYAIKGDYLNCIEYANLSLDDNFDLQVQTYLNLSLAYEHLGNPKKALKYYKLSTQAKDSVLNIEKSKQIKQMEARYQAEQKQQQIELQQTQLTNKDLQLRRQRLTIALIFSVFALLSIIGGATIYLIRRKRKQELMIAQKNEELAKEKYQNLFKESQMQAIKEKISGQEEERTRIARELHDGIGGTLAAVKMRLEETTLQPNPEDMASLVILVANTWEEVRTISHNLMPPQFTEVSVDQVLQNHIMELSKSGKIHFTIQFLPQIGWNKVPVELQVEIYRIVQELCTNIIKYSDATTVELQLSQYENYISLTMEDNGSPFKYINNGIGYRNLTERLKVFNGSFEKNSGDNQGNTYLIQIPVDNVIQNHQQV